MEAPLLGLFDAFSVKCLQLKQAVASGHDDLVRLLDRELEPMIADILSFRAETPEDAHMQLQFLNGLIRDEAEDRSSVTRRSAAMSMLIDRYFLDRNDSPQRSAPRQSLRLPAFQAGDQKLFNEAVLDSLPDRVGVITKDYRYLYANQANAQFLGRTPLSMVGCHVSEFIGKESFNEIAKPAYDRCFGGETLDFFYERSQNDRPLKTRCRMAPLRANGKSIIGAILILQDMGEAP